MSTIIPFRRSTRIRTNDECHSPAPDISPDDRKRLDILRKGIGILYAEVKGGDLVERAFRLSNGARVAEQCLHTGGLPKITGKLRFYPKPGWTSDRIILDDQALSEMCWRFAIEQVPEQPEFLIDIWNENVQRPRERLGLYCPSRNWVWRKPQRSLSHWVLGYGWREARETGESELLYGGEHFCDIYFNRRTGVDVMWYSGNLQLEITPDQRPVYAHSRREGPDPVARLRSLISTPDSMQFAGWIPPVLPNVIEKELQNPTGRKSQAQP